MEGAASAANSRSTTQAASRAHSPDMQAPHHPNITIHAYPVENTEHTHGRSSRELLSGSNSPAQASLSVEHEDSALEDADSLHSIAEADQRSHDLLPLKAQGAHVSGHEQVLRDSAITHETGHIASQAGSMHSSPVVSRQRPASPSAIAAAPAAALSTFAEPSVASQAPAACSEDASVTSMLPCHVSSQESESHSQSIQGTSAQQSPASDAKQYSRPHTGANDGAGNRKSSSSSISPHNMLRQLGNETHSDDRPRMPDAQLMHTVLPDDLLQPSSIHAGISAEDKGVRRSLMLPASLQSGKAQMSGSNSKSVSAALGSADSHHLDGAASAAESVSTSSAQSLADSDGSLQAHSMHSTPHSMHSMPQSTPSSMHSVPLSMHSSHANSATADAASAEAPQDTAATLHTAASADTFPACKAMQDDLPSQCDAAFSEAADTIAVPSAEEPHVSGVTEPETIPQSSALYSAEFATKPESPAAESSAVSQSGSSGIAMPGRAQQGTTGQVTGSGSQSKHSNGSLAGSAVSSTNGELTQSGVPLMARSQERP